MGNELTVADKPFFACNGKNRGKSSKCQDNNVTCEYCNLILPGYLQKKHIKTCKSHPKSMIITCEYCKVRFIFHIYGEHLDFCASNPENQPVKCKQCNGDFTKIGLKHHIEECPFSIKVECEYCKEKIRVGIEDEHEEICTLYPESLKKVTCDICQKRVSQCTFSGHYINCENEKRKLEDRQCAICLLEIKDLNDARYLVCFHKFHPECIEDWGKKQRICPICLTEFEKTG